MGRFLLSDDSSSSGHNITQLVFDHKPDPWFNSSASGAPEADELVRSIPRESGEFRQEAVLGKERVSFGSSVREVLRIGIEVVFLGVELSSEKVAYIGIFHDFAVAVLLPGAFAEAAHSADGYEGIGDAVKNNRRWKTLGDVFVRGEIDDWRFAEEHALEPAVAGYRDGRRDQHQRAWCGESMRMLGVIYGRKRSSKVAAGRDTVGGNVVGIDAQLGGVRASPAKNVACIGQGIKGRHGFLVREAILDRDGYCAMSRIALGGFVDPLGRAGHPASAVK